MRLLSKNTLLLVGGALLFACSDSGGDTQPNTSDASDANPFVVPEGGPAPGEGGLVGDGGCPPKDAPVQPPHCKGDGALPVPEGGPPPDVLPPPPDALPPPPDVLPPPPDALPPPPDVLPPPDAMPPPPDVLPPLDGTVPVDAVPPPPDVAPPPLDGTIPVDALPPSPDSFNCPPPDAQFQPPQCKDGGAGTDAAASSFDAGPEAGIGMAFFYQTVEPTRNAVRAGVAYQGQYVDSYMKDIISWSYQTDLEKWGDPVVSRLANGNWAVTAWPAPEDPRGGKILLYAESSCPTVGVTAKEAHAIYPSSAAGCAANVALSASKSSQIFDVGGSNYVMLHSFAKVYLARLTDSTRGAKDMTTMCQLQTPVTSFSDLKWGEATLVVSDASLLLSDTSIAKRQDGTWVMFIKGIAKNSGCDAGGGLCELCARKIYRTTSTNLIAWSALEELQTQASVPEAAVDPDGKVWVYYQDFSDACAAQSPQLASRAPISGRYEGAGHALSAAVRVSFPEETFQTDTMQHFPTNGNPVTLPNQAARDALDACMK